MIRIAITSQKGGVGKTTTSLNLAFALSETGHKVLLADADPQGSIALSLSQEVAENPGMYEMLTESRPLVDVVTPTRFPNFQLLTTGRIPANRIGTWVGDMQRGEYARPVFEQAEAMGYDLILVDTPCGIYGPTRGVLENSAHVIVIQQAEALALRSLPQLIEALGELRENNVDCALLGVLVTMLDFQNHDSQAIAANIQELLPAEYLFRTYVPRDEVFLRASVSGVPVGLLSGNPPMTAVFEHLAMEVVSRLGINLTSQPDEPVSLLD